MLKKICFSCQISLTIGERPNKKNIELLFDTKSKAFNALTWKICFKHISKNKFISQKKPNLISLNLKFINGIFLDFSYQIRYNNIYNCYYLFLYFHNEF